MTYVSEIFRSTWDSGRVGSRRYLIFFLWPTCFWHLCTTGSAFIPRWVPSWPQSSYKREMRWRVGSLTSKRREIKFHFQNHWIKFWMDHPCSNSVAKECHMLISLCLGGWLSLSHCGQIDRISLNSLNISWLNSGGVTVTQITRLQNNERWVEWLLEGHHNIFYLIS